MHGLIFKIKESHRQDQSESFVIYINIHVIDIKDIYLYVFVFVHNKSNEITSLWPVLWYWEYIYALFHRDETKPTHIIGINSFLFLIQLCYKHASPNYQHMINCRKLINKMLVYMYVCVSWNIFNRIHFFAICDVFDLQLVRCVMW